MSDRIIKSRNDRDQKPPHGVHSASVDLLSLRERSSLRHANALMAHPSLLCLPGGTMTPAEKARQFYLKEKFAGCIFAQNLANANIKKDATDGTIDEQGRFKAFKLDDDTKNAQLQCFELFPLATSKAKHSLASIHFEGFRLMLKSLDFIEKYPEEHVGPRRIGIQPSEKRLSETEWNRLNACLMVSLSDEARRLSYWEHEKLAGAIADLSRLFAG